MIEVTLQDARDQLGQLLAKARHTGEDITITCDGKPEAVIVSVGRWRAMELGGLWMEYASTKRRRQNTPNDP